MKNKKKFPPELPLWLVPPICFLLSEIVFFSCEKHLWMIVRKAGESKGLVHNFGREDNKNRNKEKSSLGIIRLLYLNRLSSIFFNVLSSLRGKKNPTTKNPTPTRPPTPMFFQILKRETRVSRLQESVTKSMINLWFQILYCCCWRLEEKKNTILLVRIFLFFGYSKLNL